MEEARNIQMADDVVDLTGSATACDYLNAIDESKADIILLTFVFQDAPLAETIDELYEGLKKRRKFYIAVALGGKFVEKQRKKLAELKIPTFEEPRVAINSLNKIVEYAMRK
jgi:acyl-CoA synthetase (NDP forming)